MKKFSRMLALMLAGVLVFGMTAFAADSKDSDDSSDEESVLEEAVESVSVSSPEVSSDGNTIVIEVPRTGEAAIDDAAKAADSLVGEDSSVVTVFEVYLTDVAGKWVDPKSPVSVTFKDVPGVVAGKNYVVLHKRGGENGVWEVLPTTVNGTTITATFTSFSPVAIVEVNSAVAVKAGKSPKTGEAVPVAAMFAFVCLGSAVLCAKKVK